MNCRSSRTIQTARMSSEDVAKLHVGDVFFKLLEKHVCNALSHDLLLALAVVSFDHLITTTHSSDIFCFLRSESKISCTSCAGEFPRF